MTALVRLVAGLVGTAVLLLFLAVVWPTPYRSIRVAGRDPRILAVREQRFTGRIELLTRYGWRAVPQTSPALMTLDSIGR